MTPEFLDHMEPVYPCRRAPTRHCPASLDAACVVGRCARYEVSYEEAVELWTPELGDMKASIQASVEQ